VRADVSIPAAVDRSSPVKRTTALLAFGLSFAAMTVASTVRAEGKLVSLAHDYVYTRSMLDAHPSTSAISSATRRTSPGWARRGSPCRCSSFRGRRPAAPSSSSRPRVASDVRGQMVKGSGHWLMEEAPKVVIPALVDFLD
jgi:pimeloyl-ACP methyl ester carboxylesterase